MSYSYSNWKRSKSLDINEQLAYLMGLVTGKGVINESIITIDFPCNNETIDGIAHCPVCGYLATKPKDYDFLKCKNETCINHITPSIPLGTKKTYQQAKSFRESISNNILPFLKTSLSFEYNLLSNNSGTTLSLKLDEKTHDFIKSTFSPNKSFTYFSIPKLMWSIPDECKIEYVNGLLDTIGFANAGGWVPREGNDGHGRMRVYFQVINRNYQLPVAIDNYLRGCFGLPIQTIDWGHPNIRDSNLADYLAGKKSAMGREHQVKFYPEYYGIFKFRIGSKQDLFDELLNHNLSCGFSNKEDWFKGKISPLKLKSVKSFHPLETNALLDPNVRLHVDAHWQINLHMGCKYLNDLKSKSAHPDLFEVTGISEHTTDYQQIINDFTSKAKSIYEEKYSHKKPKINSKSTNRNVNSAKQTEHDTYPILKSWLENYTFTQYNQDSNVYITSEQTISNFILDEYDTYGHHIESFEDFTMLSIRPDLIGFNNVTRETYFIESKITSLGLKELGQILGYCHVAQPDRAFLITTKDLSNSLRKALAHDQNLISYAINRKVEFGILKGNDVEILEI